MNTIYPTSPSSPETPPGWYLGGGVLLTEESVRQFEDRLQVDWYNVQNRPVGLASLGVTDVKNFGATGDGITLDTQAIRDAALSISTGGTLFFPTGTYLVNGYLPYYSNQTWQFARGAIIKLAPNSTASLVTSGTGETLVGILQPASAGVSNVVFQGLRIDGNKANNPSVNAGDGLELAGTSEVLVDDCYIYNTSRDGITVINIGGTKSRNILMRNIRVVGNGLLGVNGGNGVAIIGGENITLDGWHAKDNYYFGVNVEPNASAVGSIRRVSILNGLAEGTVAGCGVQAYAGGDLSAEQVSLKDILSRSNGTRGFGFFGSSTNRTRWISVENCVSRENQQEGFYLNNTEGARLAFCRAWNNGKAAANTYSGFRVHRVLNYLLGCEAGDDQAVKTQKYGFEEVAGSSANQYVSCYTTGNLSGRISLAAGSTSQDLHPF